MEELEDVFSFVVECFASADYLQSRYPNSRVFGFTDSDRGKYNGIMRHLRDRGTLIEYQGIWKVGPLTKVYADTSDESFISSVDDLFNRSGVYGWVIDKVYVSNSTVQLRRDGSHYSRSSNHMLGIDFLGWTREPGDKMYINLKLDPEYIPGEEEVIRKPQKDPYAISEEVKLGRLWLEVRRFWPNIGVVCQNNKWVAVRQTSPGAISSALESARDTEIEVLKMLIVAGEENAAIQEKERVKQALLKAQEEAKRVEGDRVNTIKELTEENSALRDALAAQGILLAKAMGGSTQE